MKNNLLNIILSVIFLCIVLFMVEVFLRVYNYNGMNYDVEMWKYSSRLKRKSANPLIGIEHIPLRKCKLQNVTLEINSRGFRDKEYVVPKPKDTYRIVALGSSITLGWGVSEDKTYLSLVENWLEGKTGNRKAEIINTAVGNYNTVREVETFFAKCLVLEPDMVIISFFINDPQVLEIKENFILRHSQSAVLIWSRYQQLIRRIGLKENYLYYYKKLYLDSNPGWVSCHRSLEKLAQYAKEHKIKVLLTMIPEIHNLSEYPFLEMHQKVKATASELNFSFLDYLDTLKNVNAKEIWAMSDDPHPSEKGHLIMAKYLYSYLMSTEPWR